MKARFELIVEWEPGEGAEGIEIESLGDLHEYIYNTLQSNANYDHVKMEILGMWSKSYES